MNVYVVEWIERVKVRVVVAAEDENDAIESALDTLPDEQDHEYHSTDDESIEVSLFDQEGVE